MEFSRALEEVERAGGSIGPQLPKANWRYVEGYVTPEQLRAIADEIEENFNVSTIGDND